MAPCLPSAPSGSGEQWRSTAPDGGVPGTDLYTGGTDSVKQNFHRPQNFRFNCGVVPFTVFVKGCS